MKIKIYQIDAFTDRIFSGNPAAICPLKDWLSDDLMQNIAMENNLAETGFFVKKGNSFQIRWFTPEIEVDLCGHATLAAAYVLYNHLGYPDSEILFESKKSGVLKVNKSGDLLTLNFPSDIYDHIILTPELTDGFNIKPFEAYIGKTDYMLVFENENQIRDLRPDVQIISKLKCRGVIVTARGSNVDFVSRFFAPQSGIFEDPVTGSAHTTLIPFWAKRLGKNVLTAIQLSTRKGTLECKYLKDRVEISGRAKTYMTGEIEIE
jgi:PhzF family phenazine biosynthesis protein